MTRVDAVDPRVIRELLSFCDSRREALEDAIVSLASLESPTVDKAAVDRCGRELASRLERLGARVTVLPQTDAGDHLRAELGEGDRQVLLLGHFDTVWPVGQLARMPIARRDGRLYGPGTYDMKGGLAIALTALEACREVGVPTDRRTVLLFTSDEETGSATSRSIIEEEARRSDAVLVLEPSLPDGAVKTARKGVGEFTIEVHGVAAHAGADPGKGVNAIVELAHQIIRLAGAQDPARGFTINAGVVEGGSRSNVVPDSARLVVDVRVTSAADAQRASQLFASLAPVIPGARVEVSGSINRPPMERTAGVAALYEIAADIARHLGFELGEGSTGGASDGNFTAALGVPTLDGLGATGDGAHALHEHVELASLTTRAALVAGLLAHPHLAADRPRPATIADAG